MPGTKNWLIDQVQVAWRQLTACCNLWHSQSTAIYTIYMYVYTYIYYPLNCNCLPAAEECALWSRVACVQGCRVCLCIWYANIVVSVYPHTHATEIALHLPFLHCATEVLEKFRYLVEIWIYFDETRLNFYYKYFMWLVRQWKFQPMHLPSVFALVSRNFCCHFCS